MHVSQFHLSPQTSRLNLKPFSGPYRRACRACEVGKRLLHTYGTMVVHTCQLDAPAWEAWLPVWVIYY